MSAKLSLSQHLLTQGRRFASLGRFPEALRLFDRLVRSERSPSQRSEEAQIETAEIARARGDYHRARRHVQIALARNPHNAAYHFLLAQLHDEDDDGDMALAETHYANAIALDPENADYVCDFGRFLLSVGCERSGLKHLERAIAMEPGNVDYLTTLAEAFAELDELSAAERLVRLARFGRQHDRRLLDLQERISFLTTRKAQKGSTAMPKTRWTGEPIILKFKRSRKPQPPRRFESETGVIRFDGPEELPAAHEPLPAKKRKRQI